MQISYTFKMENSERPENWDNSISVQTVIAFALGMLTGSIIGFTGIIILSIVGVGYYNRDRLIDTITDLTQKYNVQRPTQSNETSWYNWGTTLIGLSGSNSNTVKKKKVS